jgi:hypothetical protein
MLKRDSTSPLRLARLFARPDEQALATAMRKRPYRSLFSDACSYIRPDGSQKTRCLRFCWRTH